MSPGQKPCPARPSLAPGVPETAPGMTHLDPGPLERFSRREGAVASTGLSGERPDVDVGRCPGIAVTEASPGAPNPRPRLEKVSGGGSPRQDGGPYDGARLVDGSTVGCARR